MIDHSHFAGPGQVGNLESAAFSVPKLLVGENSCAKLCWATRIEAGAEATGSIVEDHVAQASILARAASGSRSAIPSRRR